MLSHGIFPPLPLTMPYSRRSRTSRRRPTRRPARRGTTFRRRPYRRPRRTARMSRRRILNVSSQKKQDNRLTWSNANNTANPPTQQGATLTAGNTYMIAHIPTAMDRTDSSNVLLPNLPNYRQVDNPFMRGYRERVQLVTDTPSQWVWRRICFTYKGPNIATNVTSTAPLWLETSANGFVRSAASILGTNVGTALINEVFKGTISVDWNSYFTAPIDTNRVTLKYDKIRTLHADAVSGHAHHVKLWHPMNKTLYYRTDENGPGLSDSVLSSSGNYGMGDYYIVDIFESVTATTDNHMTVSYEGTLFWHER